MMLMRLVCFGYGVVSFAIEIILFRQLFVLLGGSEFTIGWMYLVWFVFSAIGVLLCGLRGKDVSYKRRAIDLWFLTAGYILSFFLIILVVVRYFPPFAIGRMIYLHEALAVIILFLSVPAMFCGLGFGLLTEWVGEPSFVLRWEVVGFAVASVVLAVFIKMLGVLFYQLGVLVIIFISWVLSKKYRWGLIIVLLMLPMMVFILLPVWQKNWYSPSTGRLLWQRDSMLGRWEIRSLKNEKLLFYNGCFVTNFNNRFLSEISVHPACLQVKNYSKALIIGDLGRGVVREVMKYPFKEIVVLEQDPVAVDLLSSIYGKYDRLRILPIDDLPQLKPGFSFVFIGYTDPLTLAEARFLSVEFFRTISKLINPEGIISIPLYGNIDFVSDELISYTRVVFATVFSIFPNIRYLPGHPAVCLASKRLPITLKREFFSSALDKFSISTVYFRKYFWDVLLDPIRIKLINTKIISGIKKQEVSSLSHPLCFDRFFSFYLYLTDKRLWHLWPLYKRISFFIVLFILFGLPILFLSFHRRTIMVAESSFIHMSLYLLAVLWFQGIYGSFYGNLVLFTGVYMTAVGLGSLYVAKVFDRANKVYWVSMVLTGLFSVCLLQEEIAKWFLFSFVFWQALLQGGFLAAQMRGTSFGKKVYFWDLLGAGISALLVGPSVLVYLGMQRFAIVLLLAIVFNVFVVFLPGRHHL